MLVRQGKVSFVEVKALGGKRTDLQKLRAAELEQAGCVVRCVTEGDVDVIDESIEIHGGFGF
jgi:hypothetical protein